MPEWTCKKCGKVNKVESETYRRREEEGHLPTVQFQCVHCNEWAHFSFILME